MDRARRLHLSAALLTLSAAFATIATSAAATGGFHEPGQKGPYAVGHTSYVLTDASRSAEGFPGGRPIPVQVWYPVDAGSVSAASPEAVYPLDPLYGFLPTSVSSDWEAYGIDRAWQELAPSFERPFPLVVFSPGWGAPSWFHVSVGTRLASHGFVVAVPYHFGDQWWPWEPQRDHPAVAAFNRPRDLSFVLTDLLEKNVETSGHLLAGAIRPDQVAASGWSIGGYAAMVLAAGDDSVCDTIYGQAPDDPPPWTCLGSSPDPRIKAIVPLDGTNQILHFAELSRVAVPALGIGEEWSGLALHPLSESWQARPHAAFSGHPAYRVDVLGSNHQSFSDLCEAWSVAGDLGIAAPEEVEYAHALFCDDVIPSGEAHRLTTAYMIAFLKTDLAGEPGYQHMLTPGWALTREPAIEFFVAERKSPNSILEDWPSEFVYFPHQPGSAQARAAKDAVRMLPLRRVTERW